MMKRSIIVGMLTLALAGCAGPAPFTYLVLAPVPGEVHPGAGPSIAVGQVEMPPVLDRSALTIGGGDNTLIISDDARGAAPLEPMAQTVLARDLAARLPGHMVLLPGDDVPGTASIVAVNVISFLPYAGEVVLEADWRVTDAAAGTAETGRVRIVTPTTADAAAQAQAMSQALGQLADKIARQIAGG